MASKEERFPEDDMRQKLRLYKLKKQQEKEAAMAAKKESMKIVSHRALVQGPQKPDILVMKQLPVKPMEKLEVQRKAHVKRLSFSKAFMESRNIPSKVALKRKRTSSFTIDESEASPIIKRPVITEDNVQHSASRSQMNNENLEPVSVDVALADNEAKTPRRRSGRILDVSMNAGSNDQATTSKSMEMSAKVDNASASSLSTQAEIDLSKLSMREKLELWKKQKKNNHSNSAEEHPSAFTRRVSYFANVKTQQAASVASTKTHIQQAASVASTKTHIQKRSSFSCLSDAQRQKSSINDKTAVSSIRPIPGQVRTKVTRSSSDANLMRTKVTQSSLDAKLIPRKIPSATVQPQCAKTASTSRSLPARGVHVDLHSRRKSCNFPIRQKADTKSKDNAFERRKSYAESLKQQLQVKAVEHSVPARNRRVTVAGVCLAKANINQQTHLTKTDDRFKSTDSNFHKATKIKFADIDVKLVVSLTEQKSEDLPKGDLDCLVPLSEPSSPITHTSTINDFVEASPMQGNIHVSVVKNNKPSEVTGINQTAPLKGSIPASTVEKKVFEPINVDTESPLPLPMKTPRSCRKSMSVRFETTSSPQSRLTPIMKECTMREKLNSWLESRDRTPSRFSHMLKFGEDLAASDRAQSRKKVKAGLSSLELSHQFSSLEQSTLSLEDNLVQPVNSHIEDPLTQKLDAILSECLILLECDCPTATVEQWLLQIVSSLEGVERVAKYWMCRAKMAQRTGDDNAVISIFEESVRHNAQPPEEVADALKEFVDHMGEKKLRKQSLDNSLAQVLPSTPPISARARDIQDTNMFTSSAIKYCYTETTPFFSRLRSKARRNRSTPYAVVTPVRRSTRRSVSTLPSMLKDHDTILESLEQLSLEKKDGALFIPNHALHADFSLLSDKW